MEELTYTHEINALLDEALMYAYKKSAQFEADKDAMLAAANTSAADIDAFITTTVASIDAGENKDLVVKAVCASARNFILSKIQ